MDKKINQAPPVEIDCDHDTVDPDGYCVECGEYVALTAQEHEEMRIEWAIDEEVDRQLTAEGR